MSVDLTMTANDRFDSSELLDAVRNEVTRLTRLAVPDPAIYELTGGELVPVRATTLGGAPSTYVLSWVDSEDGVTLTTDPSDDGAIEVTLGVGTTRSPSEFVLSLIAASALQRVLGVSVRDENLFWTDSGDLSADTVETLFRSAQASATRDFEHLCEKILAAAG